MRDELAALADEVAAAAEQIARLALVPRVDVSHREHAAAQQAGDLGGVEAIILGLAAVDGLHVQGVAEHEGQLVVGTEVGEPVPGEHALAADDDAVAIGSYGVEERRGRRRQIALEDGLAVLIEDMAIQGPCMEIDAAVV